MSKRKKKIKRTPEQIKKLREKQRKMMKVSMKKQNNKQYQEYRRNEKDRLIESFNQFDSDVKTVNKNRVGLLCLFHDSDRGFSRGSQRIVGFENQIKQHPKFNKDDVLGCIDLLVRTEDISTSKKLSTFLLTYLSYTQTWSLKELYEIIDGEIGVVMNFYIHNKKGISSRGTSVMDFDSWKEYSQEEQLKLVS